MWNLPSIERAVAVLLVSLMPVVAEPGGAGAPGQSDVAGPRIDTVTIHGAERTRPEIVIRSAKLKPGDVLTPDAFGLSLRRLRELPIASKARVTSEPFDGRPASAGARLTKIDLSIVERPVVPNTWPAFALIGARAVLQHELRLDMAGALGKGELVSGAWRWRANRPRVALGLALPSPPGLPGLLSFDASWERQAYDATPALLGATTTREERVRAGLRLSDWSTRWLRWQTGAALDHLRAYDVLGEDRFAKRHHVAAESTVDMRFADDRIALVTSAGWWMPVTGGDRFGTAGLLAAGRSRVDPTLPFWSAVGEMSMASRVAPLALWPGAGTGQGRSGLLRAHALTDDGVVTGLAFGRDVARGSLEYARPIGQMRGTVFAVAGFVDAARAWRRLNGLAASPLYVDGGVGLRVHTGGLGAVRIDVAHGVRGGGNTTLSAGWGGTWPR